MLKINKDIVNRAIKTFIQAFVGSITINSFLVVNDVNAFKAVLYSTLIGGLSAGLSAVQNMIINHLEEK
jgi:hypothetical protein